jgi:hypothetical protein
VPLGVLCISFQKAIEEAVTEELAREGISIEVVDPRTLVPLDAERVRASVRKTGRVVIVDEAPSRCSAASEIAALIAEDPGWSCRSPRHGELGEGARLAPELKHAAVIMRSTSTQRPGPSRRRLAPTRSRRDVAG